MEFDGGHRAQIDSFADIGPGQFLVAQISDRNSRRNVKYSAPIVRAVPKQIRIQRSPVPRVADSSVADVYARRRVWIPVMLSLIHATSILRVILDAFAFVRVDYLDFT